MNYKNANIQVLDVPGLIEGAEMGKGRGREVLSVIRGCDLLILISELGKESSIERIKSALEKNGIRIDKKPADIKIEKKTQGGIIIHSNIHQILSKETIKDIILESGIKNADITIKEKIDIQLLLDTISRNRVFIPSISVINKSDLEKDHKEKDNNYLYISAESGYNLDELKEQIWKMLNFITVYLVKKNEQANFNNPLVVKSNTRLLDILNSLGSQFSENKTYAKIWGNGAKFPGQEVSLHIKAVDAMQISFI